MWWRNEKPKTLIVIKRDEELIWTKQDAAFVRGALKSEPGKKLVKILEDSIAVSLNGREDMGDAVKKAGGMTQMLDLIFRLAAKNRYTGVEEDLEEKPEDQAFSEVTTIQEEME